MSVTGTAGILVFPHQEHLERRMPAGTWSGLVQATGDVSGGVVTMNLELAAVGTFKTPYFEIDQLSVERIDSVVEPVDIESAANTPSPELSWTSYRFLLEVFDNGIRCISRPIEALPLVLGCRIHASGSALTVRATWATNTDGTTYFSAYLEHTGRMRPFSYLVDLNEIS